MREAAAHDRARSATSTNAAAILPNSAPGLAAAGVNFALFGILRLPRSSSAYVSSPRPHPLYFQVEHASRIQTEDVALALLAQEGDRGDRARRVEIPMRPVGREKQLRVRMHGMEGGLEQLHIALLQRLARKVHLSDVLARRALLQWGPAHRHYETLVPPLPKER